MIIFFARGDVDSDRFAKFCYRNYYELTPDSASLPQEVKIIREEGKKPRFDNDKAYFNLSHSHGVTMLAISHAPIGADIEKVRDIDIKKFPFIDAEDVEDFFEKWTERESYVKMTGEGIKAIRGDIPADAHFEHFDVFDGYKACVCCEEQNVVAYEIDPDSI